VANKIIIIQQEEDRTVMAN